jgi:hypothetical protein
MKTDQGRSRQFSKHSDEQFSFEKLAARRTPLLKAG